MRIAIDGVQSSGKSTLLRQLTEISELQDFQFIEEVGSVIARQEFGVISASDWVRLFADSKQYAQFIKQVYEAQVQKEERTPFIVDSSLFRLEAYRIWNNVDAETVPSFIGAAKYDQIFVCSAETSYVHDGFRSKHGRNEIATILDELYKCSYKGQIFHLKGSETERLKHFLENYEDAGRIYW